MPRRFVWHPGRGPDHTDKPLATEGKVEIRQVRSGIGHSWRMKQTLTAIGLRHHQGCGSEAVHALARGADPARAAFGDRHTRRGLTMAEHIRSR